MANHHLQAYKPTKADMKFQRQEYHASSTQCFIPKQGPGAACIKMSLNQGKETTHPKYKTPFQGNPKDFFSNAIVRISEQCNATIWENPHGKCEGTHTYSSNYSLISSRGTRSRFDLYRDYELAVDLNNCQGPDGSWANNSQLLQCSKGLLDAAGAKAAESLNMPFDWWLAPSVMAVIGTSVAVACCCVIAKTCKTAEQRQRQAEQRELRREQRQALLFAPAPEAQQLARVVAPPVIGPAPRI